MKSNDRLIGKHDINENTDIERDYQSFMKDFESNPFISNSWEMRGDRYVQLSFYDDSAIGYSGVCLTGSLQNV